MATCFSHCLPIHDKWVSHFCHRFLRSFTWTYSARTSRQLLGGAGHAYYFRVTEDLRHIVWTSVGKRQHPNDHVGAINLASLTDVVMHPLQFLPPIYQPEFVFAIKSRDQTLLLHATDALSLVRWVSCLQHYLLVVRGASLSSPQDKGTVVVSRRRLTRGGFLWKIFLVRYKSRARTANKSFLKVGSSFFSLFP